MAKIYGHRTHYFIIDEDGKIQNIFPKVKVTGHIEEVMKTLKERDDFSNCREIFSSSHRLYNPKFSMMKTNEVW